MFPVNRSSPIILLQVARELLYPLKLLAFVKKRSDGETSHSGPLSPARRLHKRMFLSHQVPGSTSVQTSTVPLVRRMVPANLLLLIGSTLRQHAAGLDQPAVLGTPIALGGKGL